MSGAEAEVEHGVGSAAYLAFSTFLTALDYLKSVSVPNEIDVRTFQNLSGQARNQVISAFKFLGLIDARGVPSADLQVLVNNQDERPKTIKKLIERCYPDIVALDFGKITAGQLDDKLSGERYKISGETKKKAKTFLLKAAQYAGFKVHPNLTKITRTRRGGKRATARNDRVADTDQQEEQPRPRVSGGAEKTIQLKNSGSVTLLINVNLLELVDPDRKFVFDLIDKLKDYEAALPLS